MAGIQLHQLGARSATLPQGQCFAEWWQRRWARPTLATTYFGEQLFLLWPQPHPLWPRPPLATDFGHFQFYAFSRLRRRGGGWGERMGGGRKGGAWNGGGPKFRVFFPLSRVRWGFTRQPESPNATYEDPDLRNATKIPREDPERGRKERKWWREMDKKTRLQHASEWTRGIRHYPPGFRVARGSTKLVGDAGSETRAWKLFDRTSWPTDSISSREVLGVLIHQVCAEPPVRPSQKRLSEKQEHGQRGKVAQNRAPQGQVSRARKELMGATLAPCNEASLEELRRRRPQEQQAPIPEEVLKSCN